MRNYIKVETLSKEFENLPNNSWEKKTQYKFNKSLEHNFNTSIDELNNNYSKQITAVMFLSYVSKYQPCTTIQVAQITKQSQANVACLCHRLKVNQLLKVINNPNKKHRHGKMKKIFIVLWHKLTELSKASYYSIKSMLHLSKLTKLIKIAKDNNKAADNEYKLKSLCDEDFGTPIIQV